MKITKIASLSSEEEAKLTEVGKILGMLRDTLTKNEVDCLDQESIELIKAVGTVAFDVAAFAPYNANLKVEEEIE